jgi:hypothetical protein
MGTRNLTIVIKNKEVRVAQYGQWDGHPSGQGQTILDFLNTVGSLSDFSEQVSHSVFGNQKHIQNIFNKHGYNMKNSVYAHMSRDIGAEILYFINAWDYSIKGPILLQNNIEFANDALFCEWAYVIDLDTNKLEVYNGYKSEYPMNKSERFYSEFMDENNYYPIKCVGIFDLNDLPDTFEKCTFDTPLAEIVELEVERTPVVVDKIQDKFERFNIEHPEVYYALIALARQAKLAGHFQIGIATLYEVLRWNFKMSGTVGEFKLNNNFRSRYARMIKENEPDIRDMFETRELIAA